jgi:hypothetical protein
VLHVRATKPQIAKHDHLLPPHLLPPYSQTMAALEAARIARAAIPNPPNTPGVESVVAAFISKVDACQSSVDRLTSMVEAELAAALADTTSALAVCRLQVCVPPASSSHLHSAFVLFVHARLS